MRNFVICVKLLILVNNYVLDAGSLVGWVSLGAFFLFTFVIVSK